MSDKSFKPIQLLKGLSIVNGASEFFFVGSGGNSPNMATGVGKLFGKTLPIGLLDQLNSVRKVVSGPNLLQWTKPRPVPSNSKNTKLISFCQFLTWANLKDPATIKSNEVVLGQISLFLDQFNVKDITEWYDPVAKKFTPEFTKLLQRYMLDACVKDPDSADDLQQHLLKHAVPAYIRTNTVADMGCRDATVSQYYQKQPLPGVSCYSDAKTLWTSIIDPSPDSENGPSSESILPSDNLSLITNGLVWPMIEQELLQDSDSIQFIRIHGMSVNYSQHCWRSTNIDKAPLIMNIPFQSLQPISWYSQKIMKLFNYLLDDQVDFYQRWIKGCFNFNSAGLPHITYDPRNYTFKVLTAKQDVLTQQNNKQLGETQNLERTALYQNAVKNIS